jgi:hypothetical protein
MDIMLSLQGLGSFLLYFAAGIAAEAICRPLHCGHAAPRADADQGRQYRRPR